MNLVAPWLLRKAAAGETVVIPSVDQLPEEAAVDRESFRRGGTKSNVTIPIRAGGDVVGGVGFSTMYRKREWQPWIVERLHTIAEILGYASERKKRVEEIQRLQDQLTHASRISTVAELGSSIAHELNQPLSAILNNAEAAQLYLASDRPNLKAARQAVKTIIDDDQRAGNIVSRFRHLFKHRQTQKLSVSIDDLFGIVECILSGRATTNDISLSFLIAPWLPCVIADHILIQQVLIALISNAFDSVCAVEGPRKVSSLLYARGFAKVFIGQLRRLRRTPAFTLCRPALLRSVAPASSAP